MEHCSVVRTLQGNFSALGLPFFISKPLSLEIEKWLINSGPRWTVERLKSLKLDLIRQKAGQAPLTWVKKNRNGGWFGADWLLRLKSSIDVSNRRCALKL
jgi:hypothetical protein